MTAVVEIGTPEEGVEIERALLASLRGQQAQGHNDAFHLVCRDADGELCAGLSASTSYGWLLIKTLWVAEGSRRTGLGAALVTRAEQLGRERGCHAAWLDTSSAGARRFYEALGYRPFAQLENGPAHQPPEHRRWFLKRSLAV